MVAEPMFVKVPTKLFLFTRRYSFLLQAFSIMKRKLKVWKRGFKLIWDYLEK